MPIVELLEGRVLPSVSFNLMEFHDPSRIPAGLKPSALGILPQDNGFDFPVGYTPDQLRTAYGIDSVMFGSVVGDGTGQTIAIVDAYDDPAFVNSTDSNFANSDLAQFDVQLGIPDPPSFTKVNENGQTSPLPKTDPAGAGNVNGNWEIEEALDVEWAHGIAPGASIVLVEANSDSNSDLFTAVATAAALPGVSAVSMSWGIDEYSGENLQDSTFVTPTGHQGVTFLAASGDNGGYAYDAQGNPTTTPGILYPAASPNVVAVGGTTLQLNADNTYSSETAWSGSGGGTSLYEKEPAYQQGSQNTGFRTTPDVAFDADPNTGVAVYDSYNDTDNSGPWVEVGGTSLAAPSWAGLIAIANQGRVLAGASTLDGPSQTLPALYAISKTDFNDITTGNNGVFSAGPGYDEVTGLGSPNAPGLMASLSTYGTANHIAITSQPPSSVIVGDSFGVVVAAEDTQGGVDPGFNGTLTISLDANPSGATLGGTLTATASDGVAVFDGLTLNQLGSGYTLQISSSKFPSITSNSFDMISNPTPWQGTFYPVPTDASLRTAINDADSNGYAFNTILLSASTYLLSDASSGGLVIDNASSLPSKTLTIAGQGQTSSIIGSVFNWLDRIFEIEGSGGLSLNVIMQNLTIQGGNAQNGGVLGGSDALGGGLLIDDANVTLTNDVVQNNQAQGALGAAGKAGAIGAIGGAGGNGDNATGGGIYLASGTLSLFNDTISGNAARGGVGGAGGVGGGQGTKSAAGVTAGQGGSGGQGGSAAGGGVYAASGTVLLDHDTFLSNQAIGGPGGTGGTGGSGGHGKNSPPVPGEPGGVGGAGGSGGAASGGAIYLAGGSLTLTGTALQKNSALGGAGGQGGAGGPGTAVGASLSGIFGGSGSTINLGGLGGSGAGAAGGNGGNGGAGGAASAGGIYVAGGSLTLVNATLAGNQAVGGQGGAGGRGGTGGFGAATNSLGLPVGKTGGSGGTGGQAGPGNGGGILVAGGKVILYASTLNANLAQGGKGGAGGTGGYGPIAALGSGSFTFGSGGGGSSGFGGTGSSSGLGGGNAVNSAGAGGNGGNGRTGQGGGLYISGGALTLSNDTVAGNTAGAGASGSGGPGGKAGTGHLTGGSGIAGSPGDSYGGGLYVNGGTVNLKNSTVALNTQVGTGSGGGAVVQSSGTVTAVSTLFGDNGSVDFSGSITATDSLFQTAPINGTLSGSGNVVGVDPLLDANGLQNNGGPTQTISLQALSPAIGKGANPDNLFADQRGYGPRSGSDGTDIGAYQANAQADTQDPTATLHAGSVTSGNASALNPYTFTITYSDNVAVAVSTLSNAVVEVLPPGSGAPISANVEGIVAVGATDGIGNAVSFVVTYQITPPGGSWTSADNGNYTVSLGGGTVTDLAGNAVASGSLGTFSVSISQTLTATIAGPSDGYSGVAGQMRTYTVSATDPSPTQQAEGFTYNIAWGDGLTDTVGPGAASPDTVSHVYSKPGTYTITLTATDNAGTTSSPVTSTATILAYELQGSTLAI
ncbi:MAG TPA: choice-of-anchor Q domain-containing protein, partial [Gemmata sp.]|nr:choice-of-anchor Q domain-containing protein [Gemmata sp.]